MKFPKYLGNYIGIVIQNNDPDQSGKIKVFIPHLSLNVYKKWNEIPKDRKFKFIGRNINSDLSDIINDLRMMLPWAAQVNPLGGESSKGRYSEYLKSASISDSSKLNTFVDNISSTLSSTLSTVYSQNIDNIGEKTGYRYDLNTYRLSDEFNSSQNNVNQVNKFSHNYIPETLSNSAKGIFGIPSVGSHVWCFFMEGDPLKPVYFGSSFGKTDWQSVYETSDKEKGINYPGSFENNSTQTKTINDETYRNKFIINQKGGTLQIVNTDNNECFKYTHISGSFKEYNNYTNIELATKNDQKLILGDSFLTVKGNNNNFTGKDFDHIIRGNNYKKIGNFNIAAFTQWKQIYTEISDIKQLFETRRTEASYNTFFRATSTKQRRVGMFASCPVCKGSKVLYYKINDIFRSTQTSITNSIQDGPYLNNSVSPVGKQPSAHLGTFNGNGIIFSDTCPSCHGSGISISSQNGNWRRDLEKDRLNIKIKEIFKRLIPIEQQLGMGGSEIIDISKHKYETIGLIMNDFGSIRIDNIGKIDNSSVNVATDGVFVDQESSPYFEYVQVDELPGGNYNLNVCNKYSVLVGAGGLSFKSHGPVNISGTITNITGEQLNLTSSNEVNIDGGKRLNLIGDIVSIKQRSNKQVIIDSSLGINRNLIVGGGVHIEGELTVNHITAPIEIQQTEQNTLYSRAIPEKIIGYGTILSTPQNAGGPKITSARTDSTKIIGYVNGNHGNPVYGSDELCIYGGDIGVGGISVDELPIVVYGTGREEDSILAYPHSHNFRNLPLTLKNTNNEVRQRGKNNNNIDRNAADPIDNKKK